MSLRTVKIGLREDSYRTLLKVITVAPGMLEVTFMTWMPKGRWRFTVDTCSLMGAPWLDRFQSCDRRGGHLCLRC